MAERLNEMNTAFKVNQKSVRENFEKMMEYEKKEKEEKGASEVSVQYSDIHRSLEDIKSRIAVSCRQTTQQLHNTFAPSTYHCKICNKRR